jgi:hypothetical protein
MTLRNLTLVVVVLLGLWAGSDAATAGRPKELGRIPWIRNYDEGLAAVRETGRPMLLLFQEVPG